jgi:hypothetical protein
MTGISVITPTLDRPDEVRALFATLAAQRVPPARKNGRRLL